MNLETILALIASSGMSEFSFEKQVGLSQGSIKNWKNRKNKPSADALTKIADYFNVSVDYLLGRTDVPGFSPSESESISPTTVREVTPEEDDLLKYFRELGIKKGAKAQAAALEMIKKLIEI